MQQVVSGEPIWKTGPRCAPAVLVNLVKILLCYLCFYFHSALYVCCNLGLNFLSVHVSVRETRDAPGYVFKL